jgi:predicted Zn-dependent protease
LVEAGRAVVRALRGDADDVEVILWEEDERSWAVKNRDLEPEITFGRLSVGLRAIKGGRLAAAATSTLDPEENAIALRVALTCAKETRLERFASGKIAPAVRAHPSLELLEREPRALFGLAERVRDGVWNAPAAARMEARVARAVVSSGGETAVLQTGLTAWAEVNSAHSEVEFLSELPADVAAIEGIGRRTLEALPERELVPGDLGGPGPIQALLHPRLADQLIRIVLQEKLTAESAVEGLTQLQPGQQIAAEGLTLWDTPSEPGLWSHLPTDDEGTVGAPRAVIERGRFTGFLGGRSSCAELGLAPTGNGFRSPMIAEPRNEAPVRDRLSGLHIEPGQKSFGDMISGLDRGVVFFNLLGLHGADRSRAAFSCAVCDGWAVRGGAIVGRLAAGRWNVSGRMLAGEGGPGMLERVECSRELLSTGRSRLPYLGVTLEAR